MRKKLLGIASVGALLALAAGCGGGSDGGSKAAPSKFVVGVSPSTVSIPLYLAESKGIFGKHGLDVELTTIQSGSAAVPQMLKGDLTFTLGDVAAAFDASKNQVPLKLIAVHTVGPQSEDRDYTAIVTKDAAIDSVKDLEGRTLAVNQLKGGAAATAAAGIAANGGDPSKVKFIEIPIPQMVDAVKTGKVDTALATEPYVTAGKDAGLKVVIHPQPSSVAGLPSIGVLSSSAFAESHPDVVKKFVAALQEANVYANGHLDEGRAAAAYTKIETGVLARVNLPYWADKPSDMSKLPDLVTLLKAQGAFEGDPGIKSLTTWN
jgi:NitT/TauT family transport system substrate-binding protein